ncbi:MAG TPA: maleylacetoacetate isomerase [Allosphingosinicella sp.]|nr:maleylacetoacetate isomerase [Allosphingosinicella sp.]
MKLTLYDYYRSSASYRVRIALNLKGAPYDRVPVNLLEGEQQDEAYRGRNPQGFVPMLDADGLRITQSLAIIGWLDRVMPEPPLLPADTDERAHVVALALTIAADIHPINNLRVLKRLTALGIDQAGRDEWYRHWIRQGFEALEALAAPRAGRFLYGDSVTTADVCLVPQMFNARRFDVDLSPYPTLVGCDAEATALEPFAAAHPDRVAPETASG